MRVCVSLLPDMNAVICFWPGSVWKGVSGAKVSGLFVPVAMREAPGAWKAKPSLRAAATSLCGQSSWNHAKPPSPATMCTERFETAQAASSASALPPVAPITSKIFHCGTASAAPAASVQRMKARRPCSRRSSCSRRVVMVVAP